MSSTFDLFGGGGGGGLSAHVVRTCLIRLSFVLKFFPHFVHVYGSFLMSVHVVRACLVRLSILLKFFPHFVHVYEVVFFF